MNEPRIHFESPEVTIWHGDCIETMRELSDGSVDAVVTDPPYGLEFMGREWDGADGFRRSLKVADAGRDSVFGSTSRTSPEYQAGHVFQEWCEAWASECLRILKPGGHLLAFGGSRTWHRLTAGIEDAGFEIRDSIAWLYGSGFPKSLDVSKAIDKAGAERAKVRKPGAASAYSAAAGNDRPWMQRAREEGFIEVDGDAPATDAAREWQGWGTALKPAFEPIVVARKPLGGSVNVRARVEYELRQRGVIGDIRWTRSSASDADSRSRTTSSGSTGPRPTEATSARTASGSATRLTGSGTGKCTETLDDAGEKRTPSMPEPSGSAVIESSERPSSLPMAASASAAASTESPSLPSTTSTAEGPLIGDASTGRSTPSSDGSDSQTDIESFAGIATGLTGSLAHVLIRRNEDGSFEWPADLPEIVTGGSTVAANVLAHGTGALNIDATRIATDDDLGGGAYSENGARRVSGSLSPTGMNRPGATAHGDFLQPSGRWPTNVVLDESQADELDGQSGVLKSGAMRAGTERRPRSGGVIYGADSRNFAAADTYGDEGGASRFFPIFRYEAKAPTSERPQADGVQHPTVKPLELMKWLCRLVTPPSGTILEPFAGSGTTLEAALAEGFSVIAIEREADYLPLIMSRIERPIQQTLFPEDGAA